MSKESNVRSKSRRVLLIGATGFVGRHLDAALAETNWEVRRATRDRSRADGPGWVYLDVEEASSIEPALEGYDAAIDLIHSIDNSSDYPEREARSAEAFRDAAERAGVRRTCSHRYTCGEAAVCHSLFDDVSTQERLRSSWRRFLIPPMGAVAGISRLRRASSGGCPGR